MIKLQKKSFNLLEKCLKKHNPDLLPSIKGVTTDFSDDFYNQLRQIVGDELVSKGFNKDYEPNEYGLSLEQLIDELGRLFMYK